MDRIELAELLLAYLYDSAEKAGHSYFFFRLNEFAGKLGIRDNTEVLEAGQLLESNGMALLSLEGSGGLSALITDDGSVFVEKGGETGVIPRFRADPAAFTGPALDASEEMGGDYRKLAVGNEIYGILTDIEEVLARDGSIDGALREPVLRALELINQRLGFGAGDPASMEPFLDEISRIPQIAALTGNLRALIDEYLR